MNDYLVSTIGRTLWGGALLIGVPITLAWMLQRISDKIRIIGKWIAAGVALLLPKVFIVYVLMLLAVIINTGFLFLERFLVRVL